MFGPWLEGDQALGTAFLVDEESLRGIEKASEWGQEILYKIREVYSGNILWRSGITFLGHREGEGRWEKFRDNGYINFTGYDYIGFSIFTHTGLKIPVSPVQFRVSAS